MPDRPDPARLGPEAETPGEAHDARTQGRSMLRWALGGLTTFLASATVYIGWQAVTNPDVRLKPQWVPEGQTFDHAFWSPLLVTVVGGGAIVGLVLWKAYKRIAAGEDLYADRFGRGVRRRGERAVEPGEEA